MGSFVNPEDLDKPKKEDKGIKKFAEETDKEIEQEEIFKDMIKLKLNSIDNQITILKINQRKILGRLEEIKRKVY